MPTRFLPALGLSVLLVTSGCSMPLDEDEAAEDDGDIGETGEEGAALTTPCTINRSQIVASVSGGRRRALERGFRWYDRGISYSQTRYFEGWRTDCSGFISMCWELARSYTTYNFKGGGGESELLRSYDELLPADALVRRRGSDGHIVMFVGWNDRNKTSACVLEQSSAALDMEFGTRSRRALQAEGFRAIRADKF